MLHATQWSSLHFHITCSLSSSFTTNHSAFPCLGDWQMMVSYQVVWTNSVHSWYFTHFNLCTYCFLMFGIHCLYHHSDSSPLLVLLAGLKMLIIVSSVKCLLCPLDTIPGNSEQHRSLWFNTYTATWRMVSHSFRALLWGNASAMP
jgi:hypothetical protein